MRNYRSLILNIFIFIFLVSCSYLPDEEREVNSLKEEVGDYTLYYLGESMPEKVFIFIPGGLVDPHVYECWFDLLLEGDSSLAILLPKYASNLAITRSSKVIGLMDEFPGVKNWVLGGHSLGGVVASLLVDQNPDLFKGLVLMASWPASGNNLSDWDKAVLSISASEDQLATAEEIETNKKYLPPGINIDTSIISIDENVTFYYEIQGGNHAGFGCYSNQEGDGVASISKEVQHEEMTSILTLYLKMLW